MCAKDRDDGIELPQYSIWNYWNYKPYFFILTRLIFLVIYMVYIKEPGRELPPAGEVGVCTMCNQEFPRGEPHFSWLGHEFCTEGCRDEWIELVMV